MFISVVALAMSVMAMATETAYVQIKLTGESGGASSVFLTEDNTHTNAFEPGVDTEKMMSQSNSKSVLMYGFVGSTPCEDVVAANLDGLVLGFTTNQLDQNYTLTFIGYEGSKTLTLYDRVEKASTVIASNGTYNFSVTAAQVGRVAINDRFVINYVAPTYVYMNGDFDNPGGDWTSWPGSFTNNGTSYSQELTLAADKWYHFKLMEQFGDDTYTAADGSSFDRDNNSHNLYVNDFTSALLLYTDVAGTYTFTWNDLTDNLTISFPAAPTCTEVRTGLQVDRYYTICLDKAVTAANGASFWNLIHRGEGVAYLEEAELPLAAGRPYIFQAEATELCVEYSGDAVAAGAYGALVGTLAAMDQTALDAAATTASSDIYLLFDNTLWLANGQSGNNLPAYRAYIVYNELIPENPVPAPGRRVRAIPMQGKTTTGVENINATETPVKTVIDGKMYILRGEHLFDATGRMVK